MASETRLCAKCKNKYSLDQDDFSLYERMKIPLPVICPACRFQQLGVWRNEITLYSGRSCGLCGKKILSMYHPDSNYVTYCQDCYYSDKWDAKVYARDYDPGKTFFDQLADLLHKVPKNTTFLSLGDGPNINSDYSNMAGGMRNCYMAFNGGISENLMYSRGVRHARDTNDSYFGEYLERCYECINALRSNGLVYARNTYDSFDSAFVLNCSGVNNCLGCVNLKNQSYHIFNQPVSREEYQERMKSIMGSYSKMQDFLQEFRKFSLKFPRRENNNYKTTNSVGDFLLECKNVHNSFEILGAENSKNLFSTRNAHNSNGAMGYGYKSDMLFDCVATGYSSRIVGSYSVGNSMDIWYSFGLKNCQECIGCDTLRNASYCILNKQYSKEDYEKIKQIIFSELKDKNLFGLMMPANLSPFAYNETIALDNMPLTKEEALKLGFRWQDDLQKTEGKETIKPEEIPDHINEVKDSITKEILSCIGCKRNYKITEQELLFYRRMVIPIPRKCFYCRHRDRIKRRGPYEFWDRICDKCGKNIKTNYAPDQPETVYCESCYQQEVY